MEGAKEEKRKSYDWEKLYDGLLEPSEGHKDEDGNLDPEYEEQELKNKLAVLSMFIDVQMAVGEKVDDKVRKGLEVLKDSFPTKTKKLKSFVSNNTNLKEFKDVFDPEK